MQGSCTWDSTELGSCGTAQSWAHVRGVGHTWGGTGSQAHVSRCPHFPPQRGEGEGTTCPAQGIPMHGMQWGAPSLRVAFGLGSLHLCRPYAHAWGQGEGGVRGGTHSHSRMDPVCTPPHANRGGGHMATGRMWFPLHGAPCLVHIGWGWGGNGGGTISAPCPLAVSRLHREGP
jgi:hypothetical protein